MKSLEIWNPFRELDEVQNRLGTFFEGFPEFGRFPKRLFDTGDIALPNWSPLVDISEEGGSARDEEGGCESGRRKRRPFHFG